MRECAKKACLYLAVVSISFTFVYPETSTAETYPSKPITWVIPSAPGGGFDTYARAVAPYLSKYLPNKPSVVIKNIPGAGGLNGAARIFKASPDGYTIGYIYYPGITILQMEADIGFDPMLATPIARIAVDTQGLFVASRSDLKTLGDLKKKDPLRFVSSPKGVTTYSFCIIAGEVLKLKYKMVTGYKGGNETATGLMRGDGDAAVLNLDEFIKYVKSGDLRVIISFSKERSPLIPAVPSVEELGYPDARAIASWKVVFGPPGLPTDRLMVLQTAFRKALEDPDLIAWAEKGQRPVQYVDGKAAWADLLRAISVFKRYH